MEEEDLGVSQMPRVLPVQEVMVEEEDTVEENTVEGRGVTQKHRALLVQEDMVIVVLRVALLIVCTGVL